MAAVALGAAVSCSKEINAPEEGVAPGHEEIVPQEGFVTWTFTADIEAPETKMGPMDGSNEFAWENNDEVKVLYNGGSTTCTASVADGETTFSPSVPDGVNTIWLVYPSNMTASLSDGKLIVNMPSAQKNNLAGYFVAQAGKDDESISFIHPVCYYKMVVDGDGEDVTRLVLSSAANDITATSVSIDFSGEAPAVAASAGGASSITYDFTGAGTYYIPLVPGEVAAGDLTFQFYRGEAKDEKAGAINYGAAFDNARASIVNWASLPAMATNRYVTQDAEGAKNGTTWEKAWNYTQFANFMSNNEGHLSADQIALYNGVKIHFAEGQYSFRNLANKLKSSIKLYIIGAGSEKGPGDTDYSHTTRFDGGSRSGVNGYIYRQNENDTPNDMVIVFRDIRFQYCNRTDDNGGVFNLKFGTIIFENCNFNNNKAASTSSGKGGGGVANIYTPQACIFKNCAFEDNSANENAGAVYKSSSGTLTIEGCTFKNSSGLEGGAIYQTGGTSNISNCVFQNNKATMSGNNWRGGGAICVTGANTVANISNCTFTGNTASSGAGGAIRVNQSLAKIDNCVINENTAKRGGAILVHTQGKCFMHNVKILDNNATDGWGMVTQTSDDNTVVCGNNLTVMGNHKGTTDGGAVFNHNKASLLLVNTTVINKGDGIVRWADNAAGTFYVLNSILLNTVASKPAILFSVTITGTSGGNSIIGNVSGNTFTAAGSDKTGMAYNASDWNWDSSNLYYTWGGSFDGTNYATSGIDPSTIQGLVSAQNSDFASWVTSVDPNGFTTDIRGTSRGSHAWPGAYQN